MAGNTWLKKLLDPKSYGLAIVLAIILHVVVIALFAVEWPKEKRQIAEPTPKNIQAKVIQTESKQVKQKKLVEEQRRKNDNWKKYLAEKKAAKKKAALEKAAKEKVRSDKAAKNKAKQLADKKKAEDLKKKDLKKKEMQKAEALKEKEQLKQEKIAEQKAFEQAQESSLLESLAEEEQQRSIENAMAEEQQVQKNTAITNDVVAQIRSKVNKIWSYPPSSRPDMEVTVRIQLVPTGEVINVSIITGSGNEALDRSVLAAVNRAQPLPVPKDIRLFEQQFRNFVMAFRPEDAVW
ncbi:Putative Tol-Pal system, TolA-like protein [Oleispira antarctica RB-8]|uniref:Putative Tol-Pal system, TolA-like protein n=1 Tax=Oleispira antarctica RB-8 TaxID=698738 RepID=R4YPA0_OLEAN|nr:Putative Tol-Pal system, TolA-like protein [Oleispira antarctica RB-8]|tara:strand:- start:603 stop:1481 length:879 start_codon:yes stop_codon:yes gene_type:complete